MRSRFNFSRFHELLRLRVPSHHAILKGQHFILLSNITSSANRYSIHSYRNSIRQITLFGPLSILPKDIPYFLLFNADIYRICRQLSELAILALSRTFALRRCVRPLKWFNLLSTTRYSVPTTPNSNSENMRSGCNIAEWRTTIRPELRLSHPLKSAEPNDCLHANSQACSAILQAHSNLSSQIKAYGRVWYGLLWFPCAWHCTQDLTLDLKIDLYQSNNRC